MGMSDMPLDHVNFCVTSIIIRHIIIIVCNVLYKMPGARGGARGGGHPLHLIWHMLPNLSNHIQFSGRSIESGPEGSGDPQDWDGPKSPEGPMCPKGSWDPCDGP